MLLFSSTEQFINSTIKLSGSKSIHNRMLILNDVLDLDLNFENSSTSEDTLLLKKALHEIKNKNKGTIDIHHAGTDMRFLTALLATKEGEWILTGSDRMKERPIGELVDALKSLGAEITFLEKENFPPLKITGKKLKGGKIEIDGSISSQFISALLLIAPSFEIGLELRLKNEIVSWPYIQMTIDILIEFGIIIKKSNNLISVQKSKISPLKSNIYNIESDWSSASYWFSIVALSKDAEIKLTGLKNKSSQADAVLPTIYKELGVLAQFKNEEICLTKNSATTNYFEYDFTNCPDIAQTVAITCFGLGIKAKLTGLKTLKLKESDRIIALKTELEKLGAIVETTDSSILIHETRNKKQETRNPINTYNDHRMAMSFAPLALLYKQIAIENPEVVTKSYPLFWEDLKSVGFNVNLQP
ncbi:MAG: 3-phosphoshikimate 1-carboxyvinyltransferase [Bacteroidota bacterium]|nr:3-phosphoshikimate 1-carboxyvinyltransferase [Bacteroidota bacterium]MDP3146304.1 3-phosphoshikimate 1-carboxyvinyltransferase [Bacteroidota bacterium]